MRARLLSLISVVAAQVLAAAGTTENPVVLYKGLGSWHHAISTRNPEAQLYFDQGLALAYSFNRYEALRSFRKASELDPTALMPYWGMALAQGPYVNMDGDPSFNQKGACAAVDAGSKVTSSPESKPKVSLAGNELAYLKVAASWCPEFKPDAYIDAARQLARAYPDDLDAQTFYADSLMIRSRWHWYDAAGKPAPGIDEAETVLQDVLRRWPQHPGANHLYIHAVESSPSPERAIASAQRLMGLAPWAGHMVHMPGHIWLVLGDWELAATVNERAVAVDREYFDRTKVSEGSYQPYYWHNLHFVMYARSMQGKKKEALEAAKQLSAASSEMAATMPEMADAFTGVSIFTAVRFADWQSILSRPLPGEKMSATRSVYSYARTLALAAQGDTAGAVKEKENFERIRSGIPANTPWGQNAAQDVMHVASEVLAAHLASSSGDAIAHWRTAVDLQDKLGYDEPPAWYYPIRESLGACLLRAGGRDEALQVFREGVRRSPRNGRMLFGLLESLKAEGKAFEAASVEREFQAAWGAADISLRIEDL